METRASYFLVGLFVLGLIAGMFALVLWLARLELRDSRIYYYVYFRGSVTGLQTGSPVRFRGVPVGTVTDISIDDQNVELIQVTLALREGTPIKTDSVASLQLQGITGLSFVQLTGGSQQAPTLEPRPGKRRAVIPASASAIEKLFEDTPELIGRVSALVEQATLLLSNDNISVIGRILGNVEGATALLGARENAAAIGTTIENIAHLTTALAAASGDIESALKQSDDLVRSLDGLTRDIRGIAGRLGPDAGKALAEIGKAAQAAEAFARGLDRTIEETREPVRDFAHGGLYELAQLVSESRGMVAALQRLAIQIERDPARFFFGDQQRGFEAR